MAQKSVVIIPTYNERDNVVPMVNAIVSLQRYFDILFIDDQSPDGTAIEIEKLQALVRRKKFADEEEKASESTPKAGEAPKAGETTKEGEKSGLGVFGWVFGGVLLVASVGAINYFRNNR
jgi:glycosyltransferase involved in cell wall biosynthesis